MNSKTSLVFFFTALALAPSAFASFHLMQVEQVIGSVDGNLSAQSIQLRMRATGENFVSQARLRAWDSTGANPVVVLNIASNVANFAAGSRILLATPAFTTAVKAVSPAFAPDFTMAAPIPASYLAAGRLTYETDAGAVIWSFAWGGSAYTGSNAGAIDNDANGVYGPPFAQSLPTSGRRGVRFKGTATAMSTTNAADYALSPDPATVIKNNGQSFLIGLKPEIAVLQPVGTNLLDGVSKRSFGTARVSERGSSLTFTISNVGTDPLTHLKITENGPNPGDFLVSKLSTTSLAKNQSTKFKVVFKPTSAGTRKAALHVRSNDTDENPFDIKLQGVGKAP